MRYETCVLGMREKRNANASISDIRYVSRNTLLLNALQNEKEYFRKYCLKNTTKNFTKCFLCYSCLVKEIYIFVNAADEGCKISISIDIDTFSRSATEVRCLAK